MKRFFCTICKKVKRVRSYPILVEFSREVPPTNPTDRIGKCDHHYGPRAIIARDVRNLAKVGK